MTSILLGDLVRTARIFHSSNIGEWMDEEARAGKPDQSEPVRSVWVSPAGSEAGTRVETLSRG